MWIYIEKSLKFKLRNDIDKFNDAIETCSIKILNSK